MGPTEWQVKDHNKQWDQKYPHQGQLVGKRHRQFSRPDEQISKSGAIIHQQGGLHIPQLKCYALKISFIMEKRVDFFRQFLADTINAHQIIHASLLHFMQAAKMPQ